MDLPKRKRIRLENYDYSSNGAYFVTICTQNRECTLGAVVGQGLCSCRLTSMGKIVEEEIQHLEERYANISIPKYVIMPNHMHLIIEIGNRQEQSPCPTLGDVVCAFKSITTKKSNNFDGVKGRKIWQARYNERIIRSEKMYLEVWQYIDTNAIKWADDCYHRA